MIQEPHLALPPCTKRLAASLIAGMILSGCGAFTAGSPASSARTSPSGASSPSTEPGFVAYVSSKWLYSLQYPTNWYDLGNFGAPDSQKYFSNENVGSPLQLDANGIWLTVDVDSQPTRGCSAASGMNTPTVTQQPIVIDGEQTIEYVASNGVVVDVLHSNWCYFISFLAYYTQARDGHMGEVSTVLSTFRFNR